MSIDTWITEIKNYINDLEESNRIIKKNLTDLFEEEEFKKLPSYLALKMTYCSFTETADSTIIKQSSSEPVLEVVSYVDPLHAPLSHRKKLTIKKIDDKSSNKESSAQKSTHVNPGMSIKVNESSTSKMNIKVNESQVQYIKVTPLETETIRKIQLNNTVYYLHLNDLYDITSFFHVGRINQEGVLIGTKQVNIVHKKVECQIIDEKYLHDNTNTDTNTLYEYIDKIGKLAICCGSYTKDDLGRDDLTFFE